MLPHDSSHAGRIERGGFREWRKREFPEQEGMEARKRFCPVEFAGREGFLLVRCVSYAGENRSSRRALKKSWRKSLTSTQKFTCVRRRKGKREHGKFPATGAVRRARKSEESYRKSELG